MFTGDPEPVKPKGTRERGKHRCVAGKSFLFFAFGPIKLLIYVRAKGGPTGRQSRVAGPLCWKYHVLPENEILPCLSLSSRTDQDWGLQKGSGEKEVLFLTTPKGCLYFLV